MADGTHTDGSASGGTHYDVLGVAADATPDEIETRFRELAKVVHPDAGGDRITFGVLYRSYEVLRDPERRAAFDAELAAGTHREVPTQTIASGSPRPLLRRSTSAQRERAQARAREMQERPLTISGVPDVSVGSQTILIGPSSIRFPASSVSM